MKIINIYPLLFFLFTIFIFNQCSQQRFLSETRSGKLIDIRLVDSWKGSEEGIQTKGQKKEWLITKSAQSFFVIDFKMTSEEGSQDFRSTGRWYIKDGLYHEYHDISGLTDIYYYKVLGKNRVKFTAKKLSIEFDNTEYEFINYRVKED